MPLRGQRGKHGAEPKLTGFLRQAYNSIDWVKTTSEREHYLRNEVVRAGEVAPDFTYHCLKAAI